MRGPWRAAGARTLIAVSALAVTFGCGSEPPPVSGVAAGPAAHDPRPEVRNVVVYLIDALRVDHVGCYGYDRGITPNLDRFAREAVVFDDAQAQSSWTRPSVASLFTGLWPQRHQCNGRDHVLSDQARTLAEILQGAGVETAAVVANGNVDSVFGFGQGFDHFEYLHAVRPDEPTARATDVNVAALAWLDRRDPERRFFLYLHTVEPHNPYRPWEPFRSRVAGAVRDPDIGSIRGLNHLISHKRSITPTDVSDLVALYDAEIAANDAAFGELVEGLRMRGLYESTLIVVLSDHGEEFFDHGGFTHGKTLWSEVLEVPLLVRFPGGGARRVEQVVELVDLMPTLLAVLGVESPQAIQGRSLLPLCGGTAPPGWKNSAVAHLDQPGRRGSSYLDPAFKLVDLAQSGESQRMVFDRRADRGDMHDLAGQRPNLVDELTAELERRLQAARGGLAAPQSAGEVDERTREQLRALGYL